MTIKDTSILQCPRCYCCMEHKKLPQPCTACGHVIMSRRIVAKAINAALPHLVLHQALDHLELVLNGCRNHREQEHADTQARAFLAQAGR